MNTSFTSIRLNIDSLKIESMDALTSASPNSSITQSVTESPSMATIKLQPVLAKKSSPATMGTSVSSSSTSVSATTSSSLSSPELLRCKRRINFGGLGYALPQTQPATVARRNERERNRVKMVNMGFATLRQHVPNGAKNKKMSKVETLKSAVEYIRQLQQLLGDPDQLNCSNGQCSDNLQSVSSDENWNPSPSSLSPSTTLQSTSNHSSVAYTCNNAASMNSSMVMRRSTNSPSSPLVTSSPTPSMGSDASSPYDSMDSMERQVSPEEEELFDFTTWFS